MSENGILGVERELDPSKYKRDPRTMSEKFSDMMGEPDTFLMVMGMIGALFFIFPAFGEFWVLVAVWLLWYTNKKVFRLPFRMPTSSGLLDPGEPHPVTGLPSAAAGISFFGNEKGTRKELWFNDSDMRTHILIFGSTGAGKTETLLSLAYNALVQGSGLIYVDGKGENVLYTKVFAMARSMGREDDMLVINYMTGSRDVFGPQEKKLSNTLNPFSSGGSGGLTELLVSLMSGGDGGGDMWKDRAISLASAIMMTIVYMRDQKEILLDVDEIRNHLVLDLIISIYKKRKDFPAHIRAALKGYLVSLPGFQESASKQSETVGEQHGYLQMQFTKILGSLADQYAFIYKTNLGEVDFKDVVLNRRILVVLLPALEKSTDELANLGKIIIACLKQMMGAALGASIEGTYADVVETKPTTSKMPFMTILDEYGYYAVKGSAVMPAQARSLGFSMIFAGQDLPAFEKASKEEAASIVANCNIKICMKLEDPDTTYSLFEKSAGEALTSSVTSVELQSGMMGAGYVPNRSANVSFNKRINVRDLKEQGAGEAHILFKSSLVRGKMFYANPPKPKYIRMNYFIRVEPPEQVIMSQMDTSQKALIKVLTNTHKMRDLEEIIETDNRNVDKLVDLLKVGGKKGLPAQEQALAAVAILGNEVFESYDERLGKFKNAFGMDDDNDDEINVFSNPSKRNNNPHIVGRSRMEDDLDEEVEGEEEDSKFNIFLPEDDVKKDIQKMEILTGSSKREAEAASDIRTNEMRDISRYPKSQPSNKEPQEIMNLIEQLDQIFDEEEEDDD